MVMAIAAKASTMVILRSLDFQSVLRVWARTDFSTGHPFALFAPC